MANCYAHKVLASVHKIFALPLHLILLGLAQSQHPIFAKRAMRWCKSIFGRTKDATNLNYDAQDENDRFVCESEKEISSETFRCTTASLTLCVCMRISIICTLLRGCVCLCVYSFALFVPSVFSCIFFCFAHFPFFFALVQFTFDAREANIQ